MKIEWRHKPHEEFATPMVYAEEPDDHMSGDILKLAHQLRQGQYPRLRKLTPAQRRLLRAAARLLLPILSQPYKG